MLSWIRRVICQPTVPKSQTKDGQELLFKLYIRGLLIEHGKWTNPVDHIGSAWRLARHYGVELGVGTSDSQLRAYLPRHKWIGEPNKSYIPLGDWVERADLCEAICICILNCRDLGIL